MVVGQDNYFGVVVQMYGVLDTLKVPQDQEAWVVVLP